MKRAKISVIGAGMVGSTTAQKLVEMELGDVVMTDIIPDMPQGKGLDIQESASVVGFDCRIKGANDYEAIKESDLVVITAGFPRKPGMTREDLISKNAEIVNSITENVVKYAPESIVVVVTNPLDIMTYLSYRLSKFHKKRVIGMAGVLDSARFSYFISEKLNVSVKDITAMVLGGHADTMVPLPRFTTVSGIPITELLSKEDIDALCKRTRDGGTEIVNLLKQGSAYYAPAASIAIMVSSIVRNERRLLPCSAYLEGEYGLRNLCLGVPVILGTNGIEKILELKLTSEENELLQNSAKKTKEGVDYIDRNILK